MKRFLPLSVFVVLPWLLQAAPAARDKKIPAAPLSFIENKGQITGGDKKPRTDVDLKLKSRGMSIFIGDAQVHYVWRRQVNAAPVINPAPLREERVKPTFETYRLDVELVGANKDAEIVKEEQRAYYENYYPKGITAHTYGKVTYKNVYPNIDWVLYAGNNELKYDFVVRPGGKASDIRMRYKGATALSMKDGAVTARTPLGSLTEKKPYSYDAVTKKEVPSSFILKNNELRFAVAASENTIVIDPVLAWGTYYGEEGQEDYAEGVATDASGNVYMAGYTYSDDYIAFNSPFMTMKGLVDAFVVKFDKDGNRQWGLYYGDGGDEFCYDVVTNKKTGDIFICGDTDSPGGLGYPNWVHQEWNGSAPGKDAFIARFNSSGDWIWGSFYGGTGDETAQRMAVDEFGEVYMTGMTRSNNNIHKAPGFKSVYGGGFSDAYVAKFSTSGTVVWATYLGGWLDDAGWSVAVDSNNNAFVAGETFSIDFYCTPDAELDTIIPHDPPPAVIVDPYNAFITKFSPPGTLLYSSMYEGWDSIYGYSRPFDLATDSKGNVFMATGKIVKFDNGGKYQWTTGKSGYRLRIDNEDNIYAAGIAYDSSGFSTPGSQQPNFAGGWDGFILKYDPAGNKTWGTYYGGINNDRIKGLALDSRNKLFVCGNTNSPGGVTTAGTHKPTWTDINFANTQAFISKWHDTIATIDPFTDTIICPPDTISIAYTAEVVFGATNTFTLQLSDANGSFAAPVNIGSFTSNNSGIIQGAIPATTLPGNGYRVRIVSTSPVYVSKDNGKNIRILERPKPTISGIFQACTNDSIGFMATSTVPGVTFTWSVPEGTIQVGPSVVRTHVTDNQGGRYVVSVSNDGCISRDSVEVVIHPRPYVVKLMHNGPICDGNTLTMDVDGSMTDVTYKWVGPKDYVSTDKAPIITEAKAGQHSGRYYVFMTSNKGCVSDSNSVYAEVIKLEASIKSVPLRTPGDTIKLEGWANMDGVTWSWSGPDSFRSTVQNPIIEDITAKQRGDYFLTVSKYGCTATTSTNVHLIEEIFFTLFPNPNDGNFTIKGNTLADQTINMAITDALGKTLYKDQVTTFRKHFTKTISLPIALPTGMYILRMNVADKPGDVKFVIMR
jgi:hypothetical protein